MRNNGVKPVTGHTVVHGTFVIERIYPVSPARVFAALSDPVAKARWFKEPDDCEQMSFEMDFRIGGREVNSGGPKGGTQHRFSAVYHDIVPERRILYSYDMHLDERRISVSLATMQLDRQGSGTRLTFTEQGAFLDGYDDIGSREHGTRLLLDALGAELEGGAAAGE
jgi:uncharacterized protein YndB with AHSA1/START domain